jgi:hypothetical protein
VEDAVAVAAEEAVAVAVEDAGDKRRNCDEGN